MAGPDPGRLRRLLPYLLLFAISFPLWYLGMRLRGGQSLLDHSPIDQQTRQAESWLKGRLDLPSMRAYLEIAEYEGRYFNSFPPTPALVEVPLVLVFGRETPTSLAMYLFWLAALCAMYAMLTRRGWDGRSSIIVALAFVFGTNVYASCVRANVWGWGQGLGFCLAILGLARVIDNGRSGLRGSGLGYLLLAFAVGCRPFYAFMLPLFVALDWRGGGRSLARAIRTAVAWMAPVAIGLAWNNWARFGDPLEFGHSYLGWARDLPHGIFSIRYVPWNAYHALLKLPNLVNDSPPFEFDPWGTAFWLNNGIFLFALYALARVDFDPVVRRAAQLGLALTWCGLILHQTNGWRQFGYRFLIDLLPIGFVAILYSYRRASRLMTAAFAWSLLINLYGLVVWKDMPRNY